MKGLERATPDVMKEKDEILLKDPTEATKLLFWTGGFDSTALILRHLRAGNKVQPIYIKHSAVSSKSDKEMAAQKRITDRILESMPQVAGKLMQICLWDFTQIGELPDLKRYWDVLEELTDALGLSAQYACLRYCRDVFGFSVGDKIEISIVRFDQLWHHLTVEEALSRSSVQQFFKGFDFPLLHVTKEMLWHEASDQEKEILRLTYSCEDFDKFNKTCLDRGVLFKDRCLPCQGRIAELITEGKL